MELGLLRIGKTGVTLTPFSLERLVALGYAEYEYRRTK